MQRLLLLFCYVLILASCSNTRVSVSAGKHDAGPSEPIDLSHVQNAVPKQEVWARYGNHSPYYVLGESYEVLDSNADFTQEGIASWYGTKFHGELTSTREAYDMYTMTAAHKTLPLPSYVLVTNLENHKQVLVRVNDRGPFKEGRIIDLSYAAAQRIDMHHKGTARVRIETLPPFMSKPADNLATSKAVLDRKDFPEHKKNYLQVGVYANQNTAYDMQARLVNILPEHTVAVLKTGKKNQFLYKVRVGPLASYQQLEQVQKSLMENHFQNFFLVSESY